VDRCTGHFPYRTGRFGLYYWFGITGEAPKDAQVVEITGKQFNWMMRYPGKDGVLGRRITAYRCLQWKCHGVDWEDVQAMMISKQQKCTWW